MLDLEGLNEMLKSVRSMSQVASLTAINTADALATLTAEVSSAISLMLEAKSQRAEALAREGDYRRHRSLRDELLNLWTVQVVEGERARTESEAKALVGLDAWELLTEESAKELLSYATMQRNPAAAFAVQAGRSLGYAFETELRAALLRNEDLRNGAMNTPLGDIVQVAITSSESDLAAVGHEAWSTTPSLVTYRNNAAHPGGSTFTDEDLKRMARKLFAGGDPKNGLLARTVLAART